MEHFASAIFAIVAMPAALAGCFGVQTASQHIVEGPQVEVISDRTAQRVDVVVDGDPFTSYLYSDTLTMLKKPVLYPIRTAGGIEITRGYPIHPIPGESVDHPHQVGLWLNYGDVNGLDFWANSGAIAQERRDEMGTIRHQEIVSTESGQASGELIVTADWLDSSGERLLRERTRFVFQADSNVRIIDRITRLAALERAVSFDDNKEGMLGLRVTRALEVPAEESGPDEDAAERKRAATGAYRNSEGISGYPDVWGQRARWMTLTGVVEGQPVTVAILDHPANVGYPTYWHARDYGLFAANPLGQAAFTDGEASLNFSLGPREETTFRFRLVIYRGEASASEVEAWFTEFAAENWNFAADE